MVRFSDIIRIRDKKDAENKQPAHPKQEGGFRLSDTPLFSPVNIVSQVIKEPTHNKNGGAEAERYYRVLLERAHETADIIRGDIAVSPANLLSDLHIILEKGLTNSIYEYAMKRSKESYDLASHSVDVTFTALLIGKAMNYDMKMLMRLGLLAMLENAGMYMIPENILKSTEKLSNNDIATIRRHPETGYHILVTLGERYAWLAEAARCAHERVDGSGYPLGLTGERVPELASILGIADTYCAMTEKRPYRDSYLPHEAIRHIAETGRDLFLVKPLKAFLYELSLFPVNTYVRLNNGFTGRVISVNRSHPLSPVLEILYDTEGHKTEEGFQIDLTLNPLLHIKECIDPDKMEIKEIN